MLSCKEVVNRSSALIDGELSTWGALQMRLHLAMCKGCGQFLDQMRITRDLIETVMPPNATDEAEAGRIDAILSQLHDKKQQGG